MPRLLFWMGYFSKNSVGDILTGVTTELSTLELQGMKMVDIIINGYAKFIAILLCFLFLSPAAAVVSVVGVAFSALALHGISRHSEKTAAITHQAMEDMSGSAIEYIRGLSIVKSFGQEGASIESFRKANKDLKNIHIKVEKGYTPFNCLHLFSLKLASMGIVFICAWQTLNGQMSLAYFLMFVLFSFVIFGSVENINDAAHMLIFWTRIERSMLRNLRLLSMPSLIFAMSVHRKNRQNRSLRPLTLKALWSSFRSRRSWQVRSQP